MKVSERCAVNEGEGVNERIRVEVLDGPHEIIVCQIYFFPQCWHRAETEIKLKVKAARLYCLPQKTKIVHH